MADQTFFVYIADVYCPWCYAFAPIMKRIVQEHPDIPVKVFGGDLISQPVTLGEDLANSPDLAQFWRKVESVSGRSLEGAINALSSNPDLRLYSPGADEILAALQKDAPGHELAQLFELEDMFYGQGDDLFEESALDAIAKRWHINPASFENVLNLEATREAMEENLRIAARYLGEITSYPTVLLSRGGKVDAVSRGFVHYETVASRLADAMADLGVADETSPYHSRKKGGSLYSMY